jgi:hypothetical protein
MLYLLIFPRLKEENQMKKKCLAVGISTVSVILLILTSSSNVVGYQTVQSSNQNVIKEKINQKELLFQTICDIANNKEIQRIILKSQMSRGIFPTSEFPVVTKNQLKMMYFIGMILSKVISKSRIQSMIGMYQFNNQEMQKEINAYIEKDTTINLELTQLSRSDCVCDNHETAVWHFPVICTIFGYLFFGVVGFILFIQVFLPERLVKIMGLIIEPILLIITMIGVILNCLWVDHYRPYLY